MERTKIFSVAANLETYSIDVLRMKEIIDLFVMEKNGYEGLSSTSATQSQEILANYRTKDPSSSLEEEVKNLEILRQKRFNLFLELGELLQMPVSYEKNHQYKTETKLEFSIPANRNFEDENGVVLACEFGYLCQAADKFDATENYSELVSHETNNYEKLTEEIAKEVKERLDFIRSNRYLVSDKSHRDFFKHIAYGSMVDSWRQIAKLYSTFMLPKQTQMRRTIEKYALYILFNGKLQMDKVHNLCRLIEGAMKCHSGMDYLVEGSKSYFGKGFVPNEIEEGTSITFTRENKELFKPIECIYYNLYRIGFYLFPKIGLHRTMEELTSGLPLNTYT